MPGGLASTNADLSASTDRGAFPGHVHSFDAPDAPHSAIEGPYKPYLHEDPRAKDRGHAAGTWAIRGDGTGGGKLPPIAGGMYTRDVAAYWADKLNQAYLAGARSSTRFGDHQHMAAQGRPSALRDG